VNGDWKKLHNEELRNLYSSLNTITMIKLRRMRWVGHVTHMGELKMYTTFLLESLKERDH
jgi:hypothetical protein